MPQPPNVTAAQQEAMKEALDAVAKLLLALIQLGLPAPTSIQLMRPALAYLGRELADEAYDFDRLLGLPHIISQANDRPLARRTTIG